MPGIVLLGGFAERKSGGFQTGYSVYGADGVCPTILSHGGGYGIMTAEVKVIGKMDGSFESVNRIYDKNQLAPSLTTAQGGGQQAKIIDVMSGAVRGRGADNRQTLES